MRKPSEFIVFPLDVPDRDQAMRYVQLLKDHVGLFKVGLELFISAGPAVLDAIHEVAGHKVFLDLKLHDIPATMARAFLAASRHRPVFVTVHCDQGEGILSEVGRDNPGRTRLLAITLLTSLHQEDLKRLGYAREYIDDLSRLALLKARLAKEAGCHGVVCSGHEVAMIRAALGREMLVVTPGIRPAWAVVGKDDQKRIVTPATAVGNGADYVVIGRPIRDARDPLDAAKRVADEIAGVLSQGFAQK
jgi:orotidine-5'-phosphate decarboxylase